ncbi:hypothetical protein V6N13_132630 [Hibiscus sabdariffa]
MFLGMGSTLGEKNQSLDLVDPNLAEFDENEVLRVVRDQLRCGHPELGNNPQPQRQWLQIEDEAIRWHQLYLKSVMEKIKMNVNGRIRTCAGRAHMISSHTR